MRVPWQVGWESFSSPGTVPSCCTVIYMLPGTTEVRHRCSSETNNTGKKPRGVPLAPGAVKACGIAEPKKSLGRNSSVLSQEICAQFLLHFQINCDITKDLKCHKNSESSVGSSWSCHPEQTADALN